MRHPENIDTFENWLYNLPLSVLTNELKDTILEKVEDNFVKSSVNECPLCKSKNLHSFKLEHIKCKGCGSQFTN